MNSSKRTNRVMVSMMTAAAFIIMTASGIVAYVVPHGRIAYWTDWSFLGLSKTNWADIHIAGSLLFVVACFLHILYNWKPLSGYFVDKKDRGLRHKKEIFVTSIVVGLLIISSIYRIPPLSYALDLSEFVKNSWVSREYEPPFGRAELLNLQSFCKKVDIPVDAAIAELQSKGIKLVNPNDSLAEVAKAHRMNPLQLYMLIKRFEVPVSLVDTGDRFTPEMVEEKFAGTGIGRKTFLDLSSSMNLNASKTMARIASLGINIKEDESLKQAAERNKIEPIELLKTMLIETYSPKKAP